MRLRGINWLGAAAAAGMLVLPLLPWPWWQVSIGGAAEAGISPFVVDMVVFGERVSIPLLPYVLLGAKLTMFAAGIALLLASVAPDRWWSKRVFAFGYKRAPEMVVTLVAFLALGALLSGYLLKGLSLPLIAGEATSTVQMGGVTMTIPITAWLTSTFWLAVAIAALAVAARVYQRKFKPPKA